MFPVVAAFQLAIVLSMVIARLVSARHLVIGAWVWTVFTLAAVFASWLILVQLLTIWTAYRLLRPRTRETPERELPVAGVRPQQLKTSKPSTRLMPVSALGITGHVPPERAVPSTPGRMLLELVSVDRHVRQRAAVQLATQELVIAVETERMLLETALRRARMRREVADRKNADPIFAEQYDKVHARLTALFADETGAPGLTADSAGAPDFDIAIDDPDPVVGELVGKKVLELRQSREAYLDECLAELRTDPVLKKAFWQALLDHNQPRVANAFVTFASTRSAC